MGHGLANLVMLLAAVLTVVPNVSALPSASLATGSLPADPFGLPDGPVEDSSDENPSVRVGDPGLVTAARRTKAPLPSRLTAPATAWADLRSATSRPSWAGGQIAPLGPDRSILFCRFTL